MDKPTAFTPRWYDDEIALLKELKVDPLPVLGQIWETIYFTIKEQNVLEDEEGWEVEVGITCGIAHFFNFKIKSTDEQAVQQFSTGSGSFTKYWPTALLIAENMIVLLKGAND